jgi:hypothetical protein
METNPVSKTLFSSFVEYQTMDKVQNPSDSGMERDAWENMLS